MLSSHTFVNKKYLIRKLIQGNFIFIFNRSMQSIYVSQLPTTEIGLLKVVVLKLKLKSDSPQNYFFLS